MSNQKALLTVNGHIFDITGFVQTITANVNGELKYRGNGILICRINHIHGNAPIFLNYVGDKFIFGGLVKCYSVGEKWKSLDYQKYEMRAENEKLEYISGVDYHLRKLHVIN